MSAAKRPRFLLDLAEELIWLKDKAGAEVAERWYDALLATVQFIEKNPYVGRERKGFVPGWNPFLEGAWIPALADFLCGNSQRGSRLLSGSFRHHESGGDENGVLIACKTWLQNWRCAVGRYARLIRAN